MYLLEIKNKDGETKFMEYVGYFSIKTETDEIKYGIDGEDYIIPIRGGDVVIKNGTNITERNKRNIIRNRLANRNRSIELKESIN